MGYVKTMAAETNRKEGQPSLSDDVSSYLGVVPERSGPTCDSLYADFLRPALSTRVKIATLTVVLRERSGLLLQRPSRDVCHVALSGGRCLVGTPCPGLHEGVISYSDRE